MKKETIVAGIVGLVVGGVGVGFAARQAVNSGNTAMMQMMGINVPLEPQQTVMKDSSMSMDEMDKQLQMKTGDEFDNAFIEMMIIHHQGAIDMANLASRAKHSEVKALSQAIIASQKHDIENMERWQMEWGYKMHDDTMPDMAQ